MRWLIGLLITMFTFTAVHAAVYEWVDSQGGVHFTDDLDKVPARYRKAVKTREPVTGREAVAPPAPQQPSPPAAPPEKAVALPGGHDESWWRARFSSLRAEISNIQNNLPEKKETLTKLHRKWVISKGRTPKAGERLDDVDSFVNKSALSTPGKHRVAYYAMKAEIEGDQARIRGLEEQLASLDAEATRAGVPFEWRK